MPGMSRRIGSKDGEIFENQIGHGIVTVDGQPKSTQLLSTLEGLSRAPPSAVQLRNTSTRSTITAQNHPLASRNDVRAATSVVPLLEAVDDPRRAFHG
jgi:hypothetical protein